MDLHMEDMEMVEIHRVVMGLAVMEVLEQEDLVDVLTRYSIGICIRTIYTNGTTTSIPENSILS